MTAIATMGVVIRWTIFAAVLVATGAAAFRFFVLRRLSLHDAADETIWKAANDRAASTAALATGIGILASALRLPLQVQELRDETIPLLPQVQALGLHTWWGATWLYQLIALTAACIAFVIARRNGRKAWMLAAAMCVLASISPALNGHALGSEQYTVQAVVADSMHVIGAGIWLGAMVALLAALGIAMRSDGGRMAADMTRFFSPMALTGAAVVIVTGLFATWLHVRTFDALWQSRYGKTLLVKLAAVGVMALIGAFNWKKAGPALAQSGEIPPMRRAVRAEVVVGMIVLLVTAFLVAMPPAGEE